MATILLIDGENFKGKIKSVFYEAKKERPIWHQYDFRGLLDTVLKDISITRKVFYFARVKEHPDSKEKSLELIEEQRLLKTHLEKSGFEVVLGGRVRGQMERVGSKMALVFKEKGVDVKIAVDMVVAACDKVADEIILCSSDSDLQPAIKETMQRGVKCIYLGFESQPNKGISYTTSRTILIRNSEVIEFEYGYSAKSQLKKEGFPHIYEWKDIPATEYPSHKHRGQVVLYIVDGNISFSIDGKIIELKKGDRFDVPIEKEHSAKVGSEGCSYIVGEMIEGDS